MADEAASRRGRRSKVKGKAFERSVAERIAMWLQLPTSDVWAARSGTKENDINLSAAARALWSYWVEAKNQKTLKIPEWIRQAEADAAQLGGGRTPVIIFKQHGDSKKYVVLDFETFMDLTTTRIYEEK